jgi:hypothetical protein
VIMCLRCPTALNMNSTCPRMPLHDYFIEVCYASIRQCSFAIARWHGHG